MIREFIDAILANWQTIKDHCPRESWLPTGISEDEYLGYGSFGCVFKTNDDRVVFKITTDESEYNIVRYLMKRKRQLSGIVKYYAAIELDIDTDDKMFVLWRESAEGMGGTFYGAYKLKENGISINSIIGEGNVLKTAAYEMSGSSKIALLTSYQHCSNTEILAFELFNYKSTLLDLENSEIKKSLLTLFDEGIVLTDVRAANIGWVTRGKKEVQVIIDPGMAVDFW